MKQVTAILLGAGQRGAEAYASYALDYPNELKFVAVAEPRADRREEFAKLHDIAPQNAVESDMELLNRPKMADTITITRMHAAVDTIIIMRSTKRQIIPLIMQRSRCIFWKTWDVHIARLRWKKRFRHCLR